MQGFSIQSTGNQVVITMERSFVDIDFLNKLFERLRVEELIKKANFSDDIIEMATEMKREWWTRNKERYLGHVSNF